MKLAIILGTRPEIIKLSPIIRACERRGIDFFIVHSGQHYSPEMDEVFFSDLRLPKPRYNCSIGKLDYRRRVGNLMQQLLDIMEREWPDAVMVQGDTFTVLMGALAAKKLDRPVAHLEAGLRSHDLTMPEENNRIITDHLSEFLFPPTKDARKNLEEEGLGAREAPVFGNTVADAAKQNADISERSGDVLTRIGVQSKRYFLATAHRQENTDDETRLRGIVEGLSRVQRAHKLPLILPMHPRTAKMLDHFGIAVPSNITCIEPLGYLEFLQAERHARLILTDSGGVQEEATIFHVPCVTLRDNTERPESVEAGMSMLAGADADAIAAAAKTMLRRKVAWKPLYGKGDAAERTMEWLEDAVRKRKSLRERGKWILRTVRRLLP